MNSKSESGNKMKFLENLETNNIVGKNEMSNYQVLRLVEDLF